MAEVFLALFETQLAWLLSPMGIGIAVGGAILIGTGLLGRIVLFVERELQIRSVRRQRTARGAEIAPAPTSSPAQRRQAA